MAILDQSSSGNPPDKPEGANPGEMNKSLASVPQNAATIISESGVYNDETYTSDTSGQNALLIATGEITINSSTVVKTGDGTSENADFYGTNAAVLGTGGRATINNATIKTNGKYANGVFAYDSSILVIKNSTISIAQDNSGGVMVAGGGKLNAINLSVATSGNSSATIRSDRGGGVMVIEGGTYKTTGIGSPAVYSTADITVRNGATLISESSEGVVIEGANEVALENVSLTDTNNTLNGNSETYKNIFIYQSMSGDAEQGTGTFTATNSFITTNNGDTFFITNTNATVNLTNNKIVNTSADSVFLRAEGAKWGVAGQNGGAATLNLNNQVIEGDVVLDSISSIAINLSESSFYKGAINSSNISNNVSLTLDGDSTFVLTGDTYITELNNAVDGNANIYSNGHTLYLDGAVIETNSSAAPTVPEVSLTVEEFDESNVYDGFYELDINEETITTTERCLGILDGKCTETKNLLTLAGAGVLILAIIIAIIALIMRGKKNKDVPPSEPTLSPDNPFNNTGTSGYDSSDSIPENPTSPSTEETIGSPNNSEPDQPQQ